MEQWEARHSVRLVCKIVGCRTQSEDTLWESGGQEPVRGPTGRQREAGQRQKSRCGTVEAVHRQRLHCEIVGSRIIVRGHILGQA